MMTRGCGGRGPGAATLNSATASPKESTPLREADSGGSAATESVDLRNHPIATPLMPTSFRPRNSSQKHQISAVQSSLVDGSGEGQRDGSRAGVAGALDHKEDEIRSLGMASRSATASMMRRFA